MFELEVSLADPELPACFSDGFGKISCEKVWKRTKTGIATNVICALIFIDVLKAVESS